ncbi:MAG TPA: cytochrome P450 [Acidimicrobiia bacterium]|jgi:cytochrome P450 family 142 subfamily A polypeptide 1
MTPNLLDPSFYADIDGMHDAFRAMRADGPVHRDEADGLWAVVRHAPLVNVERRADVFSSSGCYRSRIAPQEEDMIAKDDPAHHDQRALVARTFTPKAVLRLEAEIKALVDELIASFVEHGELDLVDDLAAPFPARLTARLIGFGSEHGPSVRTWSERLMRIDGITEDQALLMDMMTTIQDFAVALAPIVEHRRTTPADDLLSIWANAELDGCPLDTSVVVQETGLFISGGAETTRTVIARGLVELADHPDDWEAMAADPSLIPVAVEELIRWVTPLNNFFRTATRDAKIADTSVQAGDRVILLYPSANRDESMFDDPYTFDIRRNPNPHVAFGFGTHFCLGASLARLELRTLLTHLTQQITNLRVVTPPDIEPNIFVGAVRSCRMAFDRR